MAMHRRERTFMWVVGLLVGALVLDSLIVTPGLNRWRDLDLRIAKADRDLAEANRLVAREGAVKAKWAAIESRFKQGSLEDVLYFVDHLWELATRAGTSFQKTEPLKRVDARGEFNEVSYDVRLQCNIKSLSRFAWELDASPELLKVRRLNVSSRQGGPLLDVDVQVSTLELAAAPAAGSGKKAEDNR